MSVFLGLHLCLEVDSSKFSCRNLWPVRLFVVEMNQLSFLLLTIFDKLHDLRRSPAEGVRGEEYVYAYTNIIIILAGRAVF